MRTGFLDGMSSLTMAAQQHYVRLHLGSTAPATLWLAAPLAAQFHLWLAAAQARPTMTKSVVLDSVTGESQDSEVRTSTGTFFILNVGPRRLLPLRLQHFANTVSACRSGWGFACLCRDPLSLLRYSAPVLH